MYPKIFSDFFLALLVESGVLLVNGKLVCFQSSYFKLFQNFGGLFRERVIRIEQICDVSACTGLGMNKNKSKRKKDERQCWGRKCKTLLGQVKGQNETA
jgi:hypothetical protein